MNREQKLLKQRGCKDMRGSLELDRLRSRFIPGVAALLLLFSIVAQAQQSNQPGQSSLIRIIAQDEVNNPVSGAAVQIKRGAEVVSAIVTDEKSEAAATKPPPGKYGNVISKKG